MPMCIYVLDLGGLMQKGNRYVSHLCFIKLSPEWPGMVFRIVILRIISLEGHCSDLMAFSWKQFKLNTTKIKMQT